MSFQMYMLSMYRVHHLSTEMDGQKNLWKGLKVHLKASPSIYRMSGIIEKNDPIFSCNQKGDLHNTTENKNEEVVPPCDRGSNIR